MLGSFLTHLLLFLRNFWLTPCNEAYFCLRGFLIPFLWFLWFWFLDEWFLSLAILYMVIINVQEINKYSTYYQDLFFKLNKPLKKYMRRRSGALHCETQEQLLELASNNQIGLYYNREPNFQEVKFQTQWTISQAQNPDSNSFQNSSNNFQESEAEEQMKQLCKGKRYLQNCIVDKQIIRCSIQICIITSKIDQVINKILNKDTFLNLFVHTKETGQNCMYKHSKVTSNSHSNVINLQAHDFECCNSEMQKENMRMTPKNWLKNTKTDRMMQLLIIKKHIGISKNSEIGPKRISIIHRIFIIDQKYLQNPLIKIYTQKSHYVVEIQNQNSKSLASSPKKLNLYEKIFLSRSFFQKDCLIFNKSQYSTSTKQKGQLVKFKFIFHKLQQRIAKQYMRKLNQILLQEKSKRFNSR